MTVAGKDRIGILCSRRSSCDVTCHVCIETRAGENRGMKSRGEVGVAIKNGHSFEKIYFSFSRAALHNGDS